MIIYMYSHRIWFRLFYKDRYHSYIKIIEKEVNKSVNLYIIKDDDFKNGCNELLETIKFNIKNIKNELYLLFDQVFDYGHILQEIENIDKIKIMIILSNNHIKYYSIQDYLTKYQN